MCWSPPPPIHWTSYIVFRKRYGLSQTDLLKRYPRGYPGFGRKGDMKGRKTVNTLLISATGLFLDGGIFRNPHTSKMSTIRVSKSIFRTDIFYVRHLWSIILISPPLLWTTGWPEAVVDPQSLGPRHGTTLRDTCCPSSRPAGQNRILQVRGSSP